MKVQTVIKNIENTIAGKELLKEELHAIAQQVSDPIARAALETTVQFIAMNLVELHAINADLESCIIY